MWLTILVPLSQGGGEFCNPVANPNCRAAGTWEGRCYCGILHICGDLPKEGVGWGSHGMVGCADNHPSVSLLPLLPGKEAVTLRGAPGGGVRLRTKERDEVWGVFYHIPEKASGSTLLVCIWRKGAHKGNLSNLSLITEPLNTSVQALKGRCTRWQESQGRDLDLITTVRGSGQNPFPSLALSFLVAELGLGSKGPSSSVTGA